MCAVQPILWRRLHKDAILPTRGSEGAGGWDLYASEDVIVLGKAASWAMNTGISCEIPPGWVGLIRDRSSLAMQRIYTHGGVIDSDYRGEIKVLLSCQYGLSFKKGDRVAQMVVVPCLQHAEEASGGLSGSRRGGRGFGSTGR